VKRLAAVLLCAGLSLAFGNFPAARKVGIPLHNTMCVDGPAVNGAWTASTWPVLYGFNGRARLGPVQPGTCAWIDGNTATTLVTLVCEAVPGVPAIASAPAHEGVPCTGPNCASCPVPASQDFR
jgi:hypothetical protein